MKHLIRKRFLDQTWDTHDLDAAAEFWFRLYETAARKGGFARDMVRHVEVRLRGFPGHHSQALCDELGARLRGEHAEIKQPDADTISVSSGPLRAERAPPVGLWLPLLAGPPFDGLCAEVRVQAANARGIGPRSEVRATLVLVGEPNAGRLLVKSLWRSGSAGWEDDLAWSGGWPEQDSWLDAFERFRTSEDVQQKLATKLFVPHEADWLGQLSVRLMHVPLGKPRLAGLLLRSGVFLALFSLLGLAAYYVVQEERSFWLLPLAVLAFGVLGVAWTFVRNQARLWFRGYRDFRDRYTRLYQSPLKRIALARSEADAAFGNPWLRKYTSELEAAGFTYAGDQRHETEASGRHLVRVFHAPDGITYVNLLFLLSTGADLQKAHELWPASVSLVAHTFFVDGARASSVNGRAAGFRKKRIGPDHLARVFLDMDGPIEFARRHAAAAQKFADEHARRPVPHERFDLYLRRLDALHEEERSLFSERPYTWGDHLHWFLQKPRREYLD